MKRKAIGFRTAYSKEIEKAVRTLNKTITSNKYSQNDFVEQCVIETLIKLGFLK